jgi:hypothetical protein
MREEQLSLTRVYLGEMMFQMHYIWQQPFLTMEYETIDLLQKLKVKKEMPEKMDPLFTLKVSSKLLTL